MRKTTMKTIPRETDNEEIKELRKQLRVAEGILEDLCCRARDYGLSCTPCPLEEYNSKLDRKE